MWNEIRVRFDSESVMFVLWTGGTIFFVAIINHFVNVRVVMPLALLGAIMVVRQLERRWQPDERNEDAPIPAKDQRWVQTALAASAALGLFLGYVDYGLAASSKRAAAAIMDANPEGTVYFSGHSGFQYYMEARGARAIESNERYACRGRHLRVALEQLAGHSHGELSRGIATT